MLWFSMNGFEEDLSSHPASISELVGDVLETAIEGVMSRAGNSFRKTKGVEQIESFDQVPDFIVPNEYSPCIVIEAKITEDDSPTRGKVTRVQHLNSLSRVGSVAPSRFEVVACTDGWGFKIRRKDMEKPLLSTRGKVCSLQNIERLIDRTALADHRTL